MHSASQTLKNFYKTCNLVEILFHEYCYIFFKLWKEKQRRITKLKFKEELKSRNLSGPLGYNFIISIQPNEDIFNQQHFVIFPLLYENLICKTFLLKKKKNKKIFVKNSFQTGVEFKNLYCDMSMAFSCFTIRT